jgi:pectinesterase inhibitor-like protein
MARAAAIVILSVSLLTMFLVANSSQFGFSIRPMRQAPGDSIQLVCSATRYPSSCLDALLFDERSQSASSPQDLVEVLTARAMERSKASLGDARILATLVESCNNENLTAASTRCTEILDLAAYYVEISHAALATTKYEDIRAWLSGAVTQSFDCFYDLKPFRATLKFVQEMIDRGNVTVELVSNSLALVDATLDYGSDAKLWRPPPESREEQLIHIANRTSYTENWMEEANRASFHGQLTPNVTVATDSSIQAAVNQAPSWSPTK